MSSHGPSVAREEALLDQLQRREALLVEPAVVGAEQRTLEPAVGDLLDVVGAVLAAQHVPARAAHDLVHHRRQLRRRLMDQHAGGEHEVERVVRERQLARRAPAARRRPGTFARSTSSACSLTSIPATFSGPSSSASQRRLPPRLQPISSAEANSQALDEARPERPPTFTGGRVAVDVVVAEVPRPQRFEACGVAIFPSSRRHWPTVPRRMTDDPPPALLHALRLSVGGGGRRDLRRRRRLLRLPRQRRQAAHRLGRPPRGARRDPRGVPLARRLQLRLPDPGLRRQGLALPDLRDRAGVRAAPAARDLSRQQLPARRPAQPREPAQALRLRPRLLLAQRGGAQEAQPPVLPHDGRHELARPLRDLHVSRAGRGREADPADHLGRARLHRPRRHALAQRPRRDDGQVPARARPARLRLARHGRGDRGPDAAGRAVGPVSRATRSWPTSACAASTSATTSTGRPTRRRT